ncbi:MAG: protein-export chaperone SecB [Desulfovibrionaceae bacterium]|nr:protein-export chaperone SecB [Desulfovibrionaceae bacterium]
MDNESIYRLVDVFTSTINLNVDVKKIAAFSKEQLETILSISLFVSASVLKNPANHVTLDFEIEGKTKDERFNFSGIITGLFKLRDQLSNNEDAQIPQPLLSQLACEVWPYVRELASDISIKLPSQMMIRLPVNFSENIVDSYSQKNEKD